MLSSFNDLVLFTPSMKVRVVDFPIIIDRNSGCYATIGQLKTCVGESLKSVGGYNHIAFNNKQSSIGLQCPFLSILKHYPVIWRRS